MENNFKLSINFKFLPHFPNTIRIETQACMWGKLKYKFMNISSLDY